MKPMLTALLMLGCFELSGCAGGFASSWKAPDAVPLEVKGAKVAAVVMIKDEASRRVAEDTLAREITARGAQGVAMYTLLPDASPSMEAATRTALEKAGVLGIVAMRPVNVDSNVRVSTIVESAPSYRSYWGGYFGMGWGSPWGASIGVGTQVSVDQVVSVETLVYSLKQNKLVWSGTSKTTNPPKVQKFISKLAAAAAAELDKQGLIQH